MVNTCGWDLLQVKFKIDLLKLSWVCAPPLNVISSMLYDLFTLFVILLSL